MMRRATWKSFLFCTASFVALPLLASAQSSYSSHPEPLQPRIEAGAKVGTERSMGTMEGWAPIAQDDDSVLYADIRWMADDDENQEGNLGLGYRQIVSDKVAGGDAIVGGHAWIDRRRTDRGSNFYQITAGAEYLKEDWDVKANAYVPLNSEKEYTTANLGSSTPYMAGTGLYVDTAGLLVEEAQPGGDIEVGYRIPAFEQNIDAIRVYGGAYAFIGDRSDDTVGGRVRTSIDINPLINVGARFQYDEPRGSQGFLEATLRFPIKAKKRFQQHGLRARLDESPERDIDIVTGSTVTDSGLRKEVINTISGQVQRVIHVDNTAAGGGNGSVENPFNTLAAAQAAMLDNDVIYVHQGSGSTGMNQGIVIDKDNVQLIGSGTDFVYDTDRFTVRRPGPNGTDGSIIAAKTVAPTITNNQAFVDNYTGNGVLVTGDNSLVSGITVQNATGNGILILADGASKVISNAVVSDVTTNTNARRGIIGYAFNGGTIDNITVEDSTSNGNTTVGRGIEIRADGTNSRVNNAIVQNNITNNNQQMGIYNYATNGGTIVATTLRNNTANGNQTHGIVADANLSSQISNAIIENNNTVNNLYNIYIQVFGTIANTTVRNNAANAALNFGILTLVRNNGVLNNLLIENNTANSNVQTGIRIFGDTTGTILASRINNNTISNNNFNGVMISTTGTASISSALSGNTITGNGTSSANPNFYYGVRLDHDSTGTFNIDLGGGTLSSTGGNRIYNNFYRDIFIDSRPGIAAATPGTTISAQGNWWGVGTGLNQGTRADFDNGSASPGSSIDASNHLTADPGI